jgi:hypothetical protein
MKEEIWTFIYPIIVGVLIVAFGFVILWEVLA